MRAWGRAAYSLCLRVEYAAELQVTLVPSRQCDRILGDPWIRKQSILVA